MTTVLGYRSDTIVDLMRVDDTDCGEEWLKNALQMAMLVELATIPPYSCGLWSIKDPQKDKDVHHAIREIIFDEMSHLGLVGNILSAIGGTPVLADPATVPTYPGALPGGVRPELKVYLSGLNKDAADLYSQIEKPDRPLAAYADKETYTSIGAFYDKVRTALKTNKALFDTGRGGPQMEFDLSKKHGEGNAIKPIRTWQDADTAIGIIMAQGEGTHASPDNPFPGKPGELAHYYVFRELYHGRKLIKVHDGSKPTWDFKGPEIPLPASHPMGRVPAGGWAADQQNAPAHGVEVMLDEFNAHYSSMLRSLQATWRTPDKQQQTTLVANAIKSMGNMRTLARVLVRIPLPDGKGSTYGPEYRYVQREP
ncbi:ferritin-like protein [Streptomyces sp. CB03238]|uniref:ferritin-like domain-containing protein n=1 Tax=Streptomyces sp. CB03238 TaxID=1907777 RepID=UPI000A0F832D|nr:ferritin-like protein [Streptomyces sp. CB03238]ORT58796.1 hypothetical protein BKD26_16610 [Streptomyces sp. CB03238]